MLNESFCRRLLTMHDFEELNELAEEVITTLWFVRCFYDEKTATDLSLSLSKEQLTEHLRQQIETAKFDYLNFAENEELQQFTFIEALKLSFQEIKEKYLKDTLPFARKLMREDPRLDYQAVVTEEVADDFLDDLLALRWKENLKLRAYAKERNS